MTDFFSEVLKRSECEYKENYDLAAVSSARIHTNAKAIVYPKSENELINVIDALTAVEIPYVVVGGISNLLFKDKVYDGVVIKTTKNNDKSVAENIISVSCGARIGAIVRYAALMNLGGMEGLSAIPGTIGGMIKQNAGAYGYEISDLLLDALCYSPSERRFKRLAKDDMHFSYRKSVLSDSDILLISARFKLVDTPYQDVLSSVTLYREKRIQSQPITYPSLGSVFKRYRGIGAGYYVDKCGLKGYSIGGARVSEKHAGFIINTGDATADDYLRLIDYVKEKVYARFGIELEEEIEII